MGRRRPAEGWKDASQPDDYREKRGSQRKGQAPLTLVRLLPYPL